MVLKVEYTGESEKLEAAVDEDIKRFEEYFIKKLGNESLVGPERAIIKTYLHFKTIGKDGSE